MINKNPHHVLRLYTKGYCYPRMCSYFPNGNIPALRHPSMTDGTRTSSASQLHFRDHPYITQILVGHNEMIRSIAYSPDGTQLLSGDVRGNLILWDMFTQQEIGRWTPVGSAVESISIRSGIAAVGFSNNRVQLLNLSDRSQLTMLEGSIVAFSPSGNLAVGSSNGLLTLWNPPYTTPVREIDTGSKITALNFSSDGQILASGHEVEGPFREGYIILRDASGNEIAPLETVRSSENRKDNVLSLTFNSNGTRFAYGGSFGFRLWGKIGTGWQLINGEVQYGDNRAAFSPSETPLLAIAVNMDANLELWDANTGEWLSTNPNGTNAGAIAFRPDGQHLAVSSNKDINIYEGF